MRNSIRAQSNLQNHTKTSSQQDSFKEDLIKGFSLLAIILAIASSQGII